MEVAMRDIMMMKYSGNPNYKYLSILRIACLIASEELDIPTDALCAFRHHLGCLYINVEKR